MVKLNDVVMAALVGETARIITKGIAKSEDVGNAAGMITAAGIVTMAALRDDESDEESDS